jgi:hypothetical protein
MYLVAKCKRAGEKVWKSRDGVRSEEEYDEARVAKMGIGGALRRQKFCAN